MLSPAHEPWTRRGSLAQPLLDAGAVARLLPHRPPLLLLDAVIALRDEPPPALWATRLVATHEPVLAGHFPGRPVWPGAYTIEGLAQAAALLAVLSGIAAADGGQDPSARVGLLGAVDVKLVRPVRPGERLDYLVRRTHVVDRLHRFDVRCEVDGEPAARGTLTLAESASA